MPAIGSRWVRVVLVLVVLGVVAVISMYALRALQTGDNPDAAATGASGPVAAAPRPSTGGEAPAEKASAPPPATPAPATAPMAAVAPTSATTGAPTITGAAAPSARSETAATPVPVPAPATGAAGATPGGASGATSTPRPEASVTGGPRGAADAAAPAGGQVARIPSHEGLAFPKMEVDLGRATMRGPYAGPEGEETAAAFAPVAFFRDDEMNEMKKRGQSDPWAFLESSVEGGQWQRALTYFNRVKDPRIRAGDAMAFAGVINDIVRHGGYDHLANGMVETPNADSVRELVDALVDRFLRGPDPDIRFAVDHSSRASGLGNFENYYLSRVLGWSLRNRMGPRTGNVYSVASAFLCILEQLGYTQAGPARLPDRIIVRVQVGRVARNVDLLRGGVHVSDEQYAADYGLTPEERKYFLGNLTVGQFIAELVTRQGRLAEEGSPGAAADLYARALKFDPTNREARYALARLRIHPRVGEEAGEDAVAAGVEELRQVLGLLARENGQDAPLFSLDYPEANMLLGRTLAMKGRDHGVAIAALTRVIRQIGARLSAAPGPEFAEDYGFMGAYKHRALAAAAPEQKQYAAATADLRVYEQHLARILGEWSADPARRAGVAEVKGALAEVRGHLRRVALLDQAHRLVTPGAGERGVAQTVERKNAAVRQLRLLLPMRSREEWGPAARAVHLGRAGAADLRVYEQH
ncbi:MAG: hypothetical protein HY719_17945, partial [Planctomycetes bacterium]|nr:hypothetical protein [Planctomycetota bacterium]